MPDEYMGEVRKEPEADILKILNNEDLLDLKEVYKNRSKTEPHVISLIDTKLHWNIRKVEDDVLRFLSPGDSYKIDGTFIVLKQSQVQVIFVYTLDVKCEKLYEGLAKTRRIDYTKISLFSFISAQHQPTIIRVIEDLGLNLKYTKTCDIYCISKETAKDFNTELPEAVYVKRLDQSMTPIINSLWPHKHQGSDRYLSERIKYNGGYGLFIKETNEIAAWVIKNIYGQLGMIQTLEKHQKNGYGSLITKIMSKEIANEGHNPLGTVLLDNVASQGLFKKLGFSSLGFSYFTVVTS